MLEHLTENPTLTDEQIAAQLANDDIWTSKHTVKKDRHAMGIVKR
jgi:arginine repressor